MTTTRFDPEENTAYGLCHDCDLCLGTREAMSTHLAVTSAASPTHSSHRVHIVNPSRAERIRDAIDSEIDRAVEKVVERLLSLVWAEDASEEEVTAALRRIGDVDFEQAWSDALNEQ